MRSWKGEGGRIDRCEDAGMMCNECWAAGAGVIFFAREAKSRRVNLPTFWGVVGLLTASKSANKARDFKFESLEEFEHQKRRLVGLRNDDLDRDGLPMVVDNDNYEIMFEGKMYHSYEDYMEAKRSRTAGIFANSGMLAARLAIAEEMTAPGPRRAKNHRDDVAMPPLLPRRKSSRRTVSEGAPGPRRAKNHRDDVAMPPLLPRRKSSRRTVSEGIDLAATMQSSTPGAGLRGFITDGSSSMTTMRLSPLSCPGSTDRLSPAGSLLVSSGKGGDDRKDGADLVTAAGFAAKCDDDGDDDDDDIGLVSSSVGSLERCLHTINTSLSLWSPESRNFLSDFAINIKPKKTIYWVQALCPNREKSLALGTRGLEGLDRASCPSANFNDRVLEPVAERLRAKMIL